MKFPPSCRSAYGNFGVMSGKSGLVKARCLPRQRGGLCSSGGDDRRVAVTVFLSGQEVAAPGMSQQPPLLGVVIDLNSMEINQLLKAPVFPEIDLKELFLRSANPAMRRYSSKRPFIPGLKAKLPLSRAFCTLRSIRREGK